jgi:hypothetical protein
MFDWSSPYQFLYFVASPRWFFYLIWIEIICFGLDWFDSDLLSVGSCSLASDSLSLSLSNSLSLWLTLLSMMVTHLIAFLSIGFI